MKYHLTWLACVRVRVQANGQTIRNKLARGLLIPSSVPLTRVRVSQGFKHVMKRVELLPCAQLMKQFATTSLPPQLILRAGHTRHSSRVCVSRLFGVRGWEGGGESWGVGTPAANKTLARLASALLSANSTGNSTTTCGSFISAPICLVRSVSRACSIHVRVAPAFRGP